LPSYLSRTSWLASVGNHGFLALLGNDGLLHLAAPNVENGIRRIALFVDILILLIVGNGSTAVYLREKRQAEMIGTTRSRVSFFMNKFRELGLIDLQRRHRGSQFLVEPGSPRSTAD
jgi:hypothetical protein